MKTGDKIKQLRKKIGINQDDLAKKINVSRQTMINYEREDELSYDKVKKIADALGVSPEDIQKEISTVNEDEPIYGLQHTQSGNISMLTLKIKELEIIRNNLETEIYKKDEEIAKRDKDLDYFKERLADLTNINNLRK